MANWIRAAQARAEQATEDGIGWPLDEDYTFADADFIAKARGDNLRLCTALLEAVEILECVAGNECRREIGGLMSCDEFFDPTPPLSRPWSDACLPCRARRVLTRIQADPEVEHGN